MIVRAWSHKSKVWLDAVNGEAEITSIVVKSIKGNLRKLSLSNQQCQIFLYCYAKLKNISIQKYLSPL